jgi:hypothetical protein
MRVEGYAGTRPRLALEEYFRGHVRAWGMFQDRFGTIRRRFTVAIDGAWDGERLTLTEDFVYADGPTERRLWTIRRLDGHRYEGTADGVVGKALGAAHGCAFHWRYHFDLSVGAGTWRVHFDDWMFLQEGGVLFNRARVTKWGLLLGEALLIFRRQEAGPPAGDQSPM